MVKIRVATVNDLDSINSIIEQSVMSWDLPERVKRLTLDSYRYKSHDFDQFKFLVVEERSDIVAVAATEPAERKDLPADLKALLLHGLYVAQQQQGKSIGSVLLQRVIEEARQDTFEALLVKAQKNAEGFFCKQGMQKLDPDSTRGRYAYSYLLRFN